MSETAVQAPRHGPPGKVAAGRPAAHAGWATRRDRRGIAFITPFLIAFKIPACVATVAISGPAAALQQLAAPTEDGLQPDIRPALDAGIVQNCGPPYAVAPR